MSSLDEALLSDDPDSLAIEAEDSDIDYVPFPDEKSQVVAIEPDMITIGRKKRRDELRKMQGQL